MARIIKLDCEEQHQTDAKRLLACLEESRELAEGLGLSIAAAYVIQASENAKNKLGLRDT
ncbi:hypothetical protein [Aurantiacibacter spongiae]|uniref:Uncharacterized protein n=1 Tax=Aurantiacibacter spongiae TaxID=2488860 RepID=A0A3N5CSS5_9SPHN|nr:hypothetical protein [Aurantiacibacter spongiae]RPF72194.1 hypothetical protein EG799_11615 [Aurantiacibacter spongiae]